MEHATVYREPGRYAGWPANYGMWIWGDELVLTFILGYHQTDGAFHARDMSKPFTTAQARSLDGGLNWQVDAFPGTTPGGRGLSADEHMKTGMGVGDTDELDSLLQAPSQPVDLEHPDFALMCAKTGLDRGVHSFFYVSYDRCHTWQGPYTIPMFDQTGVAARTDFIVEGKHQALFFLTANKSDGLEGRVFCARTRDGGVTFEFVSFLHEEPSGSGFGIMPASVELPDGRILVAVRCRGGDRSKHEDTSWIDLYSSSDQGTSWAYVGRPAVFNDLGHNGNPATLTLLPDGRVCMIYGNRDAPYTICAKLSDDGGASWGDEIVLRGGGGSYDIGYPRTVLRDDGTLITGYYFNEGRGGDGERFAQVTLWRP